MLVLSSKHKQYFIARIGALSPQSKRQFGTLELERMVAHLRLSLEASLGEVDLEDSSTFFKRHVMRPLVFTIIPWPKGTIKVPDYFTPPAKKNFEEERKDLFETLERFVQTAEREPARKTVHPLFGPMTLRFWQTAHGKHFNHHLEQFGT